MSKRKFFKVYAAPGYPTDPKADEARALDYFVNSMSILPWKAREFNHEALTKWLAEQAN